MTRRRMEKKIERGNKATTLGKSNINDGASADEVMETEVETEAASRVMAELEKNRP